VSTVKASELFPGIMARRPSRKCGDCSAPNPTTPTHADPQLCPACVGAHSTHCRSCTVLFTRDGLNVLCPSCRGQIALFGATA
jgi:Zn finger protein HypA/HybF involved in hydrogenase expression